MAADEVTEASGEKDIAGSGSREDDREEDMVEPGAESLELKLVLLCGLSGLVIRADEEAVAISGGITPNGRPAEPVGTAPAEPGLKFDLQTIKTDKIRFIKNNLLQNLLRTSMMKSLEVAVEQTGEVSFQTKVQQLSDWMDKLRAEAVVVAAVAGADSSFQVPCSPCVANHQ